MNRSAAIVLSAAALLLGACETTNTNRKADGGPAPAPRASGEMSGPRVASTGGAKAGTVNAFCAIMHEHPVSGGQASPRWVTEFKGQKVGFCCEDCVDAWKTMSDEERSKALAESIAKNGKP